jgi:hypothetical protein
VKSTLGKGHRKGTAKTGGRTPGTPNKRSLQALSREQIAEQAQDAVNEASGIVRDGRRTRIKKLGKEVLEEFMELFAGMAATYQPLPPGMPVPAGRLPDENKFLTYAKLTVDTARSVAEFQSPKFKAIAVMAPPPQADPEKQINSSDAKVVRLTTDPNAMARVYQQMIKGIR